jgi:hypothetical protein
MEKRFPSIFLNLYPQTLCLCSGRTGVGDLNSGRTHESTPTKTSWRSYEYFEKYI